MATTREESVSTSGSAPAKAAPPKAAPTSPGASHPLVKDVGAAIVVFLVAVPLCLGIALASGAPLLSGVLAGIVGGIVVGSLSGSHTSVSGPAAGLTAVVAGQIAALGFEAFLLALVLAGLIQIGLGVARAGFIAAFVPSSVIKGLLAAIGVILILKQIPHLFGHDADPEGDLAFRQPDQENTLSAIVRTLEGIHPGASVIGLLSIGLLVLWSTWAPLKRSPVPAALVVVVVGVGVSMMLGVLGEPWSLEPMHRVTVPVAGSPRELLAFLEQPDFSAWSSPPVYVAAGTIALVASLETLLNLGAVDALDPERRRSPPNRELIAQGVGNLTAGLIGGIPVTSVIVRSSVNVSAGAKTKRSAILHGVFLLASVAFLPSWLNAIPLSCLAAILLATGAKLVSPALVKDMWQQGWARFAPFATTVVAIVFTDLLLGIVIGLAVSTIFILYSNVRRPIHRFVEKHIGGEVTHIQLANQVSFLNRAALSRALDEVPAGHHVMIDAEDTDYVDPDVLDLIREFTEKTGPARGVRASLTGFRETYPALRDRTQYVDYSTRELQSAITPEQALEILASGHERFQSGRRLKRDLAHERSATAGEQHPIAVVVSCIDSRTPAELIFDVGLGDIFSVRIAGNVSSRKILGSVEFGCAVAGAKLVLVMGHTGCGAVTAAVDVICSTEAAARLTSSEHLVHVVEEIRRATGLSSCPLREGDTAAGNRAIVDEVARRNVLGTIQRMRAESHTLERLEREGHIAIVGAMYDVTSGALEVLRPERSLQPDAQEAAEE